VSSRTSRGTMPSGSSALTPRSYSRHVSSTVSAELADPAPHEPWTSPGAAAQRPPRLLLTLLGDYWWQRTEPLPSAAIVALLVAFSIPEDNRAARDALRKQLRWRGFAPLYDGLWVSPRDHAAEVIGYLKDLDITTGTAFRASSVPADGEIPARAWDLDGLRQR